MALWGAGFCPLHPPGLNPHGTYRTCRCGTRRGAGGLPRAALARPAPGERTISNAEVPLPRSPLSLAAGTAHREPLPAVFAANRGYSLGDARGEAPCIKKPLSSPLPAGKGGGGMGAESKLKAKSAGDRNRHASAGHRNAAQTPLRKGQSPTPGICLAGSVSAARVQPRGCKGRSPLHKKTFVLPPSRREERSASAGRGDILPLRGRGAENQAKGKVGRRPKPLRPLRAPECRPNSAPQGAKPHSGNLLGRLCKCRSGSAPGMQGAKPLA